jgi:predicted LPLAT superfamily acyltransferase
MRLMARLALLLGRPVARLLLYPICLYFLIFSVKARAASSGYLRRVLGRKPRVRDVFRHYHTFAGVVLDRVYLLSDQYSRFDVHVHGSEIVDELAARGEGCLLLGAHLGSFEIVRSLGRAALGSQVRMLMYEENARKLGSVLEAINPGLHRQVITLGRVDSILSVEAALKQGAFVGILGDRTIKGEGTIRCCFLGENARLGIGPFRIATMLDRKIVLMFGIYRGGSRYDIYFERLAAIQPVNRTGRSRVWEESLRQYVGRLEHYCRLAPYNWFNFYDFWE